MLKKFCKIMMISLFFSIAPKIDAQEISFLETKKTDAIVIDDEIFHKYVEFENQKNAKEYILSKYDDVVNKVKKYNEDEYFNIDDSKFQKLILSLDIFETEREKEFRKYIDIYENHEKNIEMDKLYAQYLKENDKIKKMDILLKLDDLSAIDYSEVDKQIVSNLIYTITPTNNTFKGAPIVLNPLNPGTYSNGYNRNVARDYAYDWAHGRNNTKYGYYSRYNGNCYNCWQDCADFVSQILYEGGMNQYHNEFWPIVGNIIKEHKNNWYYYDNNGHEAPSHTWGGAPNFYKHWSKRTYITSNPYYVSEMDPVSIDFNSDGDMDHTVMVLTNYYHTTNSMYYAAHTNDTIMEKTIAQAVGSSGTWYAYRMNYARNNGTFVS